MPCGLQVQVNDLVTSPAERERLFAEIRVLKQLKHKVSRAGSTLSCLDFTGAQAQAVGNPGRGV